MLYTIATLHLLGLSLADRARTKLTSTPERGSETIEKVLWAGAIIVIVGAAVAIFRGYVQREAAKIQ